MWTKNSLLAGVLAKMLRNEAATVPPFLRPEVKPEVSKFFLSDEVLAKFAPRAVNFANGLNLCVDRYQINTPKRAAAWLGQVYVESGGFRYVRELWGKTPSEWQRKYEGHKGLGNTEPGDGFKFRGRGLIQTTGRKNTLEVSRALFGDARLLDTPELLEQPDNAALSAGWYWFRHGLNALADNWRLDDITRGVNGRGMLHHKDRVEQSERALKLLS